MLRTFPSPFSGGVVTVTVTSPVASVCPFDGRRDDSWITVAYEPDLLCVEFDSLRAHLALFADQSVSHEEIAQRVAAEIRAAVEPRALRVTERFMRDGLVLSVEVAR